MSAKAIREYDGKRLLSSWMKEYTQGEHTVNKRFVQINPTVFDTSKPDITFDSIAQQNPWLVSSKLVVKPDQLIKRRGKANLLLLNATWEQVKQWIADRMHREIQVEVVKGMLDHFIVEEFVPHAEEDEFYVCIQSHRNGEEILFHHEGGINIGDVDSKAVRLNVNIEEKLTAQACRESLLGAVPVAKQSILASFMSGLFQLYRDLNFVYMEINPLVVVDNIITPLDMAAKLDETAAFLCGSKWGPIEFPAPFGRAKFPEEAYIQELDSKTGASLKLTILNHHGRIWSMVAGGGASVVFADTVSDYGYGKELANYGEYSGAPNEAMTYEYARTILDLMTRERHPEGKILLIGGGIANFTDVSLTFRGIIHAIEDFQDKLKSQNVVCWVRRGGPNYQEGLKNMKDVAHRTGVSMHVFGPETHMTAIVPMALGKKKIEECITYDTAVSNQQPQSQSSSVSDKPTSPKTNALKAAQKQKPHAEKPVVVSSTPIKTMKAVVQDGNIVRVDSSTRCIVYGLQQRAVQGMLDFDYLCKRDKPSVAAMIFPFSGNHYLKFYWGTGEILIPVYQDIGQAVTKHKDVSILINFSSFRSVYPSTMEALKFSDTIKTITIIAEGVPESQTRALIAEADRNNVGIIGPATVGGIKPGCLRLGNTGGMLDNIVHSKLYRAGSVAYVSKSGGMSNELNNIISHVSNGVYEGVAIGGDKYPGSRFIDHLLRYEANPEVKILVLLGEVGGGDEYDVCEALRTGRITKPLVAWCIGTCAKIFPFEVQFGHAGACAGKDRETATAKNAALADAGAVVPPSFDDFGLAIQRTYRNLVECGTIIEKPEVPVPKVPMDYAWAKNLGLIRKPANFISSISDDRGGELMYAGMPISEVFSSNLGVGGVLSLLWFKRNLPCYATKFIEMVLMVTADHGPAVSGAHNTIVTARAGKDLISSLVSGLVTIGPRFGGALDAAAELFSTATESGLSAEQFVKDMRKKNKLIMGIGHRIKSLTNPDKRVTIIKQYAQEFFPSTKTLEYALDVEKVTTKKKSNLILNVDGCIAVCFVDLLYSCGAFTREEANEHIANGCLNGLFVLGRSIGFIGHYLDQKRLKQPLYRHPWDDISYMNDYENNA